MLEQRYISGDSSVKIAASIEGAIAAGRALAGESLPPVRAVARFRRVSAATVAAAYRLLRDRGLVVADGRRGTQIRPLMALVPPPAALPSDGRDLASGNPDPDLLPRIDRAIGRVQTAPRLYGDVVNHPDLVAAARRQFKSDGIPAQDIFVVSGALDGVERVLREHLRPGDRVIVEDPCFSGIADLLATLALNPVGVEVDDEGFVPAALRKALQRSAAAIIVTPRAQNPTGAALSAKRQRTLRSILRTRREVLLIEDDHAGPVAGAPYRTLVEASRLRWAVVRSVSKSLGPDLRVAVMTSDPVTASRVERRQTVGIRWVSHLLQQLVAILWRDRSTSSALNRAARVYTQRRDALLRELEQRGIAAHGRSGLNIWIPVAEEAAVMHALLQKGWAVQAGERYRLASPPAIRVTTATLNRRDAEKFARDLASILDPGGRSSLS